MARKLTSISQSATALRLPFVQGNRWVNFDHIVRLEGVGNYTTCFLADGSTLLVALTIKCLHDRIPEGTFVRLHRKHLVNWRYVSSVSPATKAVCLTTGERVRIARRRIGSLCR